MINIGSLKSEHSPEGAEFVHSEYIGCEILGADMDYEKLRLKLDSGKTIEIWDGGQSCCEHRHMSTDDDVQSLVGCKLDRIETKNGPAVSEEDYSNCYVHEIVFVEVGTNKGFITLVNHNEHNGYYGGFSLTITEKET